jgi:hypothetical protein
LATLASSAIASGLESGMGAFAFIRRHSLMVRVTHAPSVSGRRAGGATGRAGASSAAQGPVFLRPRDASRRPPWEPLAGLHGTLGGVPGLPCGARAAAILGSRCEAAALRPCASRRSPASAPLLALCRKRSQRASWISALQHEGPPSRRRPLPRWVLVPNAPSRARTASV